VLVQLLRHDWKLLAPSMAFLVTISLSNMVWGCAKLRFLHPQLLAALAGRSVAVQLTPQGVASALYSFARLGQRAV
jgi:hypothetical protein